MDWTWCWSYWDAYGGRETDRDRRSYLPEPSDIIKASLLFLVLVLGEGIGTNMSMYMYVGGRGREGRKAKKREGGGGSWRELRKGEMKGGRGREI